MKNIFIIVGLLIAVSGAVFFVSQPKPVSEKPIEAQKISIMDDIKSKNGQIIDVREPSEYIVGHADSAINIPLGDIVKLDFSKIDSKRPIYLICRSGRRAGEAKVILEKNGFSDVTNIGGMVDWESKGGNVCKSSQLTCS